jgi:hypothetical protein
MTSIGKGYLQAFRLLLPVFLATALLIVSIGERKQEAAAPSGPPDDWDLPQLIAYLNSKGLGLHAVPTMRDSSIRDNVYLTTKVQPWDAFVRLTKDPTQIDRWKGTVYCERSPLWDHEGDPLLKASDCSLVIGPFFLFGDPELVGRVRDAFSTAGRP